MMKHLANTLLVAILACMSVGNLSAQGLFPQHKQEPSTEHDHGGRFFVGGAVSFWTDKADNKLTLDLCPEVGYLFDDNWGAGVLLGYEYERKKLEAVVSTGRAFKVSPFVRYYYFHREPFNLYFDAGAGVNFLNEKVGNASTRLTGFEVGIRPGACVDLTEGLCLCLRMGFLGYRSDYFMGEEPGIGSSGWGFRFAPEELMIGLELEF